MIYHKNIKNLWVGFSDRILGNRVLNYFFCLLDVDILLKGCFMDLKFLYCENCGKIIAIVKEGFPSTVCCQSPMKLLSVQNDKHLLHFSKNRISRNDSIPIITVKGKTVSVTLGSKISKEKQISLSKQIDWILIQSGIVPCHNNLPVFSKMEIEKRKNQDLDFAVLSGERLEAEFCLT